MSEWNPDYVEMLSALSEEGVEFLLIGAFAMAAHDQPRATSDIDFWVRPSAENATKIMRALRRFGAPLHDLSEVDLTTLDVVFQIGLPPRRIDILTKVSGLTFDEAWGSKMSVSIRGIAVAVIGREALIKNKLASGRLKDLADVEALGGNPRGPQGPQA